LKTKQLDSTSNLTETEKKTHNSNNYSFKDKFKNAKVTNSNPAFSNDTEYLHLKKNLKPLEDIYSGPILDENKEPVASELTAEIKSPSN
jgi:hypothetical protein